MDNFTNILLLLSFFCLERRLKVVLENNWVKNNLTQIDFTRIFKLLFEFWKMTIFWMIVNDQFCKHLAEEENTLKYFSKNVDYLSGVYLEPFCAYPVISKYLLKCLPLVIPQFHITSYLTNQYLDCLSYLYYTKGLING